MCFPEMHVAIPVHRLSSVPCELRNGPIVKFVSEEARGGCFRSLIQTSPTGCHLPPLTMITVEAIHEAGEWEAVAGVPCSRKRITVKVAFEY